MTDKKNQHYVPQYYFRFFSSNSKSIGLVNLQTGKFIPTASIKGQASKSYFYGDADMENRISELENLFLPPLKKLKASKTFNGISEKDFFTILCGIVFQRSRTQAARVDLTASGKEWAKIVKDIAINTAPDLTDEARSMLRENTTAVPNMQETQRIYMLEATTNSNFLADLGMGILKNRTNRPFIFGDAPVVFMNYFQKKIIHRGVLGMRNPGLQIYFPLDSRTAIYMYDVNTYSVQTNKKWQIDVRAITDIDKLNSLQIHNAASSVYFASADDADYTIDLWKRTRRVEFTPKGRHNTYSVQHEDEEKHVFHQFDSQLKYIPDLGFSPCPALAESDLLIDRSRWNGKKYLPEIRQWYSPTPPK